MDAVRAVAATARSESVERERTSLSPEPLVRALAEAGLGALRVPRQFGGAGAQIADLAGLLVEVAAAESNLTQIVRGHLGFVEYLIGAPPGAGRNSLLRAAGRGELFGPAASTGAAGAAPGSTPRDDRGTRLHDGGTRLSGRKFYSTGSLFADWLNVLVPHGSGFVEAVVRRDDPGVEIVDDWNGFGQRLTASGTAVFDAAVVGDGHVFDRNDPTTAEFVAAFYQFVHSATQAGIVGRAGEDVAGVVRRRRRTYPLAGAALPAEDPQVLGVVGEVVAAARTSAAVVASVAGALDRSVSARGSSLADDARAEAVLESAAAQVTNTRLAGEATWRLFDAASASAVDADAALDRHWRNARTISSHNPAVYKSRLLGEHAVTGSLPRPT